MQNTGNVLFFVVRNYIDRHIYVAINFDNLIRFVVQYSCHAVGADVDPLLIQGLNVS